MAVADEQGARHPARLRGARGPERARGPHFDGQPRRGAEHFDDLRDQVPERHRGGRATSAVGAVCAEGAHGCPRGEQHDRGGVSEFWRHV